LQNLESHVSLKQWVGHRAREALLMPALLRRAKPRVAFLPSSNAGGSALLRAVLIAQKLRDKGWNAVSMPPQLEIIQTTRFLKRLKPDVMVFQTCRHGIVEVRDAMGCPYILDLDDADFYDPVLRQRTEDTAKGALGVIAGSRYIRAWAHQFNPTCRIVWTGTPITRGVRPTHAERSRAGPIVTWAQSSPLGYMAELDFLARILRAVAVKEPRFSVRLYGVNSVQDQEKIKQILGLGQIRIETLPNMPYERFLASLRSVSVGLSHIAYENPFSRGKSFGKILGYLDAMVPVVCSDHCDHNLFFTPGTGFVSNDEGEWQEHVLTLIRDTALRDEIARRAFARFQQRLSLDRASELVGSFIKSVI
jgi:hypothetical protein